MNTITLIQELYFDVCDLSYGQSYQSLGYKNKIEFLSEFKRKLEIIEKDYQQKEAWFKAQEAWHEAHEASQNNT